MAELSLQAEAVRVYPVHRITPKASDCMELLAALHEAQATYAVAIAAGTDDGEQERLSDAADDALHAFMLSPAKSVRHLAWKLKTYQTDDLKDWFLSDVFIAAMVADADNLA